ncbi:DNA glycosylase AlkZ-like family protein [Metallococcus carri]|uniref:DNA glycosylase AlkZ-like family protein n=1 Tax=Metallococcus carri TaxID=1656884 RepID=UPI002E2CD777|nr:crosslink repair DNA glycosylase YcaQ family protein [Metallococcus carri]
MLKLSRQQARRVAIRAALLDAGRPNDLTELTGRLRAIQHDQTSYVAPNAELVCWSRLGRHFEREHLRSALATGELLEIDGFLRPAADFPVIKAEQDSWPGPEPLADWQEDLQDWMAANDLARREILDTLTADGPLPAAQLPDSVDVSWRSSGWNNNRNRRMLIDLMSQRGEIAIAGREGREAVWDIASRVYPTAPAIPHAESVARRNEDRLRSLGIARARAAKQPSAEPVDVGEAGEEAVVEGVRGRWQVDPAYLEGRFSGRCAIVSPLDRVIYDRKRMVEIFEFDYQLEMYKPATKRRWGYFALPILSGDRFVGKVDAESDWRSGVLRVNAIHEDEPFSARLHREVTAELRDLARLLDLELVLGG